MSVNVEKAKQIALDFQINFSLHRFIEEDHIKRAIQYFETDFIVNVDNGSQGNSREVLNEIIDIFLPIYMEILEQSSMQYEQNQFQSTRWSILELLNKLLIVRSQSTNVRLYALLLDIIRKDNETNAVFATKILIEFIKQLTEQINDQQAEILQKINDFGLDALRNGYYQQKVIQSGQTNKDSSIPPVDPKLLDLLNVLADIDKSYPQLEVLTEDLYKLLCDKSKLFIDISNNYKDPIYNIYKEQSNSLRNKISRDKSSGASGAGISSQSAASSSIQSSASKQQNEKLIPSAVSLQILSQIPLAFIIVANLDLQPFFKICREFQKVKQNNNLPPLKPQQSASQGQSGDNNPSDETNNQNNLSSTANNNNPNGDQQQISGETPQGNTLNTTSSNRASSYEAFSSGLVKQLRELISNIIRGVSEVKIQDVYEELGKNATLELVNALIKIIQFLFVLIKKNNDIQKRALFQCINQATLDQILDADKIIECSISLIDKCPEEFYQQRIEAMVKLKNFIAQKGGKLKLKFLNMLSNEQKMIGSTEMISIYGKNQVFNTYLEINKNAILTAEFQRSYLQHIQLNPPRIQDVTPLLHIINTQIESLLKNIFDNQLYTIMQERSFEQIKEFLRLFIINPANIKLPREIRQFKHNIFMKILHAIQLKYKEIRRNFHAIKKFIAQLDNNKSDSKDNNNNINTNKQSQPQTSSSQTVQQQLPQDIIPQQLQSQKNQEKLDSADDTDIAAQFLHLNQMPFANIEDYDDLAWKKKRVEFIEKNKVDIESNLQSIQQLQLVHLEIYSDKETLLLNGTKIKKGIDKFYIREVKNRIIDHLIEIQREIQAQLFKENREDEYNAFVSKYRNLTNNQVQQRQRQLQLLNMLRDDQRLILQKILKYGLQVFECLHDAEHTNKTPQDYSNITKTNHLLLFMQNFSAINDKISFKDIFQPNMDLIFKQLLKYNDCNENCIKSLILDPFVGPVEKNSQGIAIKPPSQSLENSHLAQILTIYLMHKLNTNIEHIDPFSPFYEYKDKFFTLVQQIIKIPLRSFIRLQDYDFVYTYFRQIIIFLIKKAHNSQYPIEYLNILRTLFRSVFQQSNEVSQVGNNLMNQFFSICNKTEDTSQQNSGSTNNSGQSGAAGTTAAAAAAAGGSGSSQQQGQNSSTSGQQDPQYQNINILENLVALFDTDIAEIKFIVCELILMLPLRVKHIVSKAKLLGRPLVKSLSLLDQNNTIRILRTIDNIFGYSTQEEIQGFFDDVKDELIDKLYEILYEQRLVEEIRRKNFNPADGMLDKKIQNDPVTLVVKLLGRMNHMTRATQIEEKISQELRGVDYLEQFAIHLEMKGIHSGKELKLPMNDIILHCIDIFNKIIDNFYCQTVRGTATQSAFCILKIALLQFFPDAIFDQEDNNNPSENQNSSAAPLKRQIPSAQKLFETAFAQSSDDRIAERENLLEKLLRIFFEIVGLDQKLTSSYSIINQFKKEAQKILEVLNKTICTLYKAGAPGSKQYLRFLTLSGIRSAKMKVILTREELHQNKEQVCGQIEFVQKLFKSQQGYLLDGETASIIEFQEYYLQSILCELLSTQNQNKIYGLQVILLDFLEEFVLEGTLLNRGQANVLDVMSSVFVVLNQLPDILNLKTTKVSSQILAKILKFYRKHKDQFEKIATKKLLQILFNNLLSYREFSHTLAKDCLISVAQILKCNSIDLFHWRVDTPEFEETNTFMQQAMFQQQSMSQQEQQQLNHPASAHFANLNQLPISQIIDQYPNTYLAMLLAKIKTSIQNFSLNYGNFENSKQMKYLANAYKSLEFLLCVDQSRLPFRVLVNEQPKQGIDDNVPYFPEKNFKFDQDIVSILQSSDLIIIANTEKMSKHVKIIVENTKVVPSGGQAIPGQPSQSQQQPMNSQLGSQQQQSASSQSQLQQQQQQQLSQQQQLASSQQGNPQRVPQNGSSLPQQGNSQQDVSSRGALPGAGAQPGVQAGGQNAPNQSQQAQQQGFPRSAGGGMGVQNTFQINNQVYLNIEEFDLNIEDVDIRMKEQSYLIQSILSFLKSLLLLPAVKRVVKTNLKCRDKNHQDSSDILSYRYKIVLKLFNQMTRIERGISEMAQSCLSEMISQESHPKELLNNEEKLKSILKPVLMCLSNPFSTFTPSFLQVLKKILKLLTPCFNKALSDKLTNHLDEVTKDLSVKYNPQCISGLLKLFQYLQYAYQTAFNTQPTKQKEYMKKSIDNIIVNIHKIEVSYAQTEGKHQIQQITRKSLCEFMNSMSSNVIDNYFTETDPEIINLLLEVLKLDKAMVVRERLTRDSNQSVIQRLYNKGRDKENKISFLRIIKCLGDKNSRLMQNNQSGIECVKEKFSEMIKIQRDRSIAEGAQMLQIPTFNSQHEIDYYLKILVLYCQQKHTDIDTLFALADFMSIRLPRYTYFIQDFFHFYLPQHYSPENKKAIFERFLDITASNADKKERIETIINISYHIIYPMLVHSHKLGHIQQIVDARKYVDFLSFFAVPKLIFPFYRIEIEILQLSTLLLPYMQLEVSQLKKQFIQFGWKYMKVEDKILKHFGYIYTSQFIRLFVLPDEMIIGIYISLLSKRQDDSQHPQDNEIGALSKKALNYLIQHFAYNSPRNWQNQWLKWTMNIFQEEQTPKQPSSIRFLSLFIKNHKIFYHFRQQFANLMVNSMQQLIIHSSRPVQSLQNNRIAWDLSFLCVEWAFMELKQTLKTAETYARNKKIKAEQLAAAAAVSVAPGSSTPSFKMEEESQKIEKIEDLSQGDLIGDKCEGFSQQSNIPEEKKEEKQFGLVDPANTDNTIIEEITEKKSENPSGFGATTTTTIEGVPSQLPLPQQEITISSEELLLTKVELIDKFSEDNDQGVKLIIIPFFIKLIQNILQMPERDKDEKQFVKKTLYLLKKIFFIWPNNVMRHDYYKKELSKFSNNSTYFYFCQLSILSIILEFESNEKLLNFFPIVYKLLDSKQQQSQSQSQMPGNNNNNNNSNNNNNNTNSNNSTSNTNNNSNPSASSNANQPANNNNNSSSTINPQDAASSMQSSNAQQQGQNQSQPSQSQQQTPQQTTTLLQNEHSYVVLILSTIFKRLLTVASLYKENENASEFTRNVQHLVKESIEQNVKLIHTTNTLRQTGHMSSQSQNLQIIKQAQPMSITLAIKVMRVLYELDERLDLGLRNIKNLVQYQLENAKRCKQPYDGYYLVQSNSQYIHQLPNKIINTHISVTQNKNVQQEFSEEYEESLLYNDEMFDSSKVVMMHTKQNFISLLRTLALKINYFQDRENQDINAIVKLLASNLEKIQDLDIRIESVNLLKCLLLGEKGFADGQLPVQYARIKPINLSAEKKIEKIIQMMNYIARVFDKKFGLTNLPLRITSTLPDYAAETLSLKTGEETIVREFMGFLVATINDSGINKLEKDYVRYLLLLFAKNSSSKDLSLFFQLAGDLSCTSEFNLLLMMLGQFQSDKCFERISEVIINPNAKDINLENLEQDEVLLLGFKLILFRIVDCASNVNIKLSGPNFIDTAIGDSSIIGHSNLSQKTLETHKDFFELKKYSLNKRDIIEFYGEMMTSAQLKQSAVTSYPISATDSNAQYTFILQQPYVTYNCPIVPNLLIPAFKRVFDFMVKLAPQPIELRHQAMVLFEHSLLRLNYFPHVSHNSPNQSVRQYISTHLGQTLTEIILDEVNNPTGCIFQPEKLSAICKEYAIWSQVQNYLEKTHFQKHRHIIHSRQINPLKNFETAGSLEYLQHILGELNETDLSYGLKYYLATSPELKRAISIHQQREWVDAQNYLIENSSLILSDTPAARVSLQPYEDYSQIMDHSIYKTLFIETQKHLNRWDELQAYADENHNTLLHLECLYNAQNFVSMKKQYQRCAENGISCENAFKFHCQSLIEFLRTTSDEYSMRHDQSTAQSQNLSLAFYQTLKEWTKFPRNYSAVHVKHSTQLQLLIELEEGYRVRESKDQQQIAAYPALFIEQLSKNASSLINQWRERMPSKHENLTTWKNIIEQRNLILTSIHNKLKDKVKIFLLNMQQLASKQRKALLAESANNPNGGVNGATASGGAPGGPSSSVQSGQTTEQFIQQYLDNDKIERMLAPFTDSRWNILKYLRVQRLFGNNSIDKMPNQDAKLHPEEVYLRAKLISSIYRENESFNNLKSALETIEKIAPKDQEEFKHQKADLLRKRALLYWQNEKYLESTEDMQKSIQVCDTYFKTWKSWLDICFTSYLKRKNSEYWARNAMQLIPQALKYKSFKSQLIFCYALFVSHMDPQFFVENMKQIAAELPKPQLLLWTPFMFSALQNTTQPDVAEVLTKLLGELILAYPQPLFYQLRALLDLSSSSQTAAASNNANILALYNGLRQGQNSALLKKLETFADILAKQPLQSPSNFHLEAALADINRLIEDYAQFKVSNNSSILQLSKKAQSVLERLSTFPFFSKEIMTSAESGEFAKQLCSESCSINESLQLIRIRIYQPLLSLYLLNYSQNRYSSNTISSEQLLSLSQSTQEIELPGQYSIPTTNSAFRDFDPSTHLTVSSFGKQLLMGFRNHRVTRQILLNASNSKQYSYEIEDLGHDCSRERTFQQSQIRASVVQQMQEIMNILFSVYRETNIRHTKIQNAQRFALVMRGDNKFTSAYRGALQLMLTPSPPLTISFQDILDLSIAKNHLSAEEKTNPLSMDIEEQSTLSSLDSFNSHLDSYSGSNYSQINSQMKEQVTDSILQDFMHSKAHNLSEYFSTRKTIAYSFSSTMFFNYFLGRSLLLEDIRLDPAQGIVTCSQSNIELTQDARKITVKNIHSIRLSRNISNYLGEMSILGITAPTFISMAKAITSPKYAMKEICALFLNEMLIANGIQDNIASEEFGSILKKFYDKILWLYVEDINNTWSQKQQQQASQQQTSSEFLHSENGKQGDSSSVYQNAYSNNSQSQSRTNNGYMEPVFPRAYTILETVQQNQLHNENSLHFKYWF